MKKKPVKGWAVSEGDYIWEVSIYRHKMLELRKTSIQVLSDSKLKHHWAKKLKVIPVTITY